ncbi:hypothetical protein OTK49_01180 [Vibrio coralliirubri]|uniref:hypothetical protein n=1 Tax=Vibrio coralliirubri TaxID=1516159 RepID=UPI002283F1C5|nr:hypothetical protein [Vibrio coralliirubri]MCY9861142.1 hypothetical protein [Vibrio coralliirubri]
MSDKDFAEIGTQKSPIVKPVSEPSVLDAVAELLSEAGHDTSMPEHEILDVKESAKEPKPTVDKSEEADNDVDSTPDAQETSSTVEAEGEAQNETEEKQEVVQQPIIHHAKQSKLPAILSSLALMVSLGLAGGLGYERYVLVLDNSAELAQLDEATNSVLKLTEAVESIKIELLNLKTDQSSLSEQVNLADALLDTTLQEYLKKVDLERQLDGFGVVMDIKDVETKFQESLLASLELSSAQSSVILSENQASTKEWVSGELDSKLEYMLEHVGGVIASLKLDNDRYQRNSVSLRAKVEDLEKYLIEIQEKKFNK